MSGGGDNLLDLQVMGAMGQSACAPQSMRDTSLVARIALSPFATLGREAQVMGNVCLMVGIVLLHAVLVQVLPKFKENLKVPDYDERRQQRRNFAFSLFAPISTTNPTNERHPRSCGSASERSTRLPQPQHHGVVVVSRWSRKWFSIPLVCGSSINRISI
jgi:hypothetical protein